MQPSPDLAFGEVLAHLGPFLPPDAPGLPPNQLALVASRVRNIALGHRRGYDLRAGQPVAALTGLFLDATARIEIWGASPDDVDFAMGAVQANLLNAAPNLRAVGFLSFFAEQIGSAAHEAALPAWRKSGDFRFRYEFHAVDSDEAESFVVRIPILSDVDADPASADTQTVIDAMRRWDEEAAPMLALRGGGGRGVRLTALSAFDFRPGGFVGAGVTVERTVLGTVAAPNLYPTLADFLLATTDPTAPDRNARASFATLLDFLNELPTDGAPIVLGDWNADSVPDVFQPRRLEFASPLNLATPRDLFTISHAQPAFATPAIVYLRVHTIPPNSG